MPAVVPFTRFEGWVNGRWLQRWTWKRVGASNQLATSWVFPFGTHYSVTGAGIQTLAGYSLLASNEENPTPVLTSTDVDRLPKLAEAPAFSGAFQLHATGPFHAVCVSCNASVSDIFDIGLECY